MSQPIPASIDGKPQHAPLRAAFVEFTRFIAIGGIAAIVNLVSRYLLDFLMPFEAAVVLAYICGMIVGFLLFQGLLFRSERGLDPRRMTRFVLVNIFGATLAWAVSSLMARQLLPAIGWGFYPFEVAHLAGVAAPAISSYFLHKHYTFAKA